MDIDDYDFLPARMNAFWFTYVAIFLFALLPNFGLKLDFFQIITGSGTWVIFVNLWSIYNKKPIMDERKQRLVTSGMAWAFVVVSILLIPMATTGVEVNAEIVRGTAEMGLWTWLIYFSVKNLMHKYGGGKR